MKYQVFVNNTLVKEYPYKSQAMIYCFLNGYVNSGRGWFFLDDRIQIKKIDIQIKGVREEL